MSRLEPTVTAADLRPLPTQKVLVALRRDSG
jgi:hypothetical protein